MLCSKENRFGHGQSGCTSFFAQCRPTKTAVKTSKKSSAKAMSVMEGLPKLSSARGTAGEMSPGHGAACLGELGNAFFRGKMGRFGAVEVLRWRRTVDGMERLCRLLLAMSSPWITLDSEVHLQVPCRHPAPSAEAQATCGIPAGCPIDGWPPLGACGSGVSVCQQMPQPSPLGVLMQVSS